MNDVLQTLRTQDAAAKASAINAIGGNVLADLSAAADLDAARHAHAVQQELYADRVKKLREHLLAEFERGAALIEAAGYPRPRLQTAPVLVRDKGPEYRAAKEALMRKVFVDPRTRTMDRTKLRTVYLREAEREAGYHGELPATIWNKPFYEWEQSTADRSLIANALVQTDANGKPLETLDTLAKIHARIAERAAPTNPLARAGATGKTFGRHGRVEFLPGKRIAWFGRKPSAYRGEGGSMRLTIKDGTTRQDVRIRKALAAAPFNVNGKTIDRWIANAEARASDAEHSPIEAQRNDFERYTGSREL